MPFESEILEIIQHTDIEFTFRMSYKGEVKPGQFFEVSIPKYGEAPISVSGIGEDYIDLTIRKVGVVTDVIHTFFIGDNLFLRGPFGNGFDVSLYENKEVILGIRPEDLHSETIVGETFPTAVIAFYVEVSELLGHEFILHGITQNKKVIAKVASRVDVRNHETIQLSMDLSKIHFFDPATENCII